MSNASTGIVAPASRNAIGRFVRGKDADIMARVVKA
jgi:hypothetical protein